MVRKTGSAAMFGIGLGFAQHAAEREPHERCLEVCAIFVRYMSLFLALSGPPEMSCSSPQCATKRTSVNPWDL
jgi:hypothetical protein